jgi:tricorn protease
MKKFILLLLSAIAGMALNAQSLHFASKPSLSPDGAELFFSWSGDIFRVPSKGGLALRMISMKGNETSPIVSPDGKLLAFASNETGNNNVYVVPLSGGAVIQLTFHDGSDIPVSWSPDSKRIYFESNRYNTVSVYSIPVIGGTPQRLFQNYFNTISALVENPVTGDFYFTESAESYRFATRRGYRGEHNANIISWNPSKKEYKEVTSWIGKDQWPMVDALGNLYYVSDEKGGEDNIVRQDGEKRTFLTNFKESVRYPSISRDGSKIVFLKGYEINILDIKSGDIAKPSIHIADSKKINDQSFKVEVPEDAAISPDGKKLAYVYRGMLFVSDAKGKFSKKIETPENERVSEVLWAKDSKNLYYTRTNNGYYNIFKKRADTVSAEKILYKAEEGARSMTISPKGDKIAFISGKRSIMILDTEKEKSEKISDQEFWAYQGYSINFSSDQNHLAFTAMNMFEEDIFIYSFADKNIVNLTNSAVSEGSPLFTPDGKSMYMVANRLSASYPRGATPSLYKVMLDKVQKPLEIEEFDKLFGKSGAIRDSSVVVDHRYLQRRFSPVVRGGYQTSPYIFTSKEKSWLLFGSNHEGSNALYVQELKNWDQKPPKKVTGIASSGKYISNNKDLLILGRGGLYKIDPSAASATKIEVDANFTKNISSEFRQMFYEVWATLEENFYDEKFHGVNWSAKRDYYASFLPYAGTRDDVRTLINDMLNELNSSHMGFSTFGKDEETPVRNTSIITGIMFQETNPYIVERIVPGSPSDFSGNPIEPGDRLVAVNGIKVSTEVNREKYMVSPTSRKEVVLKFAKSGSSSSASNEYEVKLHTTNSAILRSLIYTEWEDSNRDFVERMSNGKLAYVHMRDMSAGSLENFLIDMNTYAVHKEGLILDLRFNNGGNVHNEVIEFLSQKKHFNWKYREGAVTTHPNVTPADKPIVVLINERSLSDAEVTSNGIRELSIAKLIGTETYRWIIFTSGVRLVDGSSVRLPAWGCYTLDGKNLESTGVKPDISIRNTFKDRVESKDPQLERAIKELLPL